MLPVVGRKSFKFEKISKPWNDEAEYKVTSSCCPDFVMRLNLATKQYKIIEPYRKKLEEYHPHILKNEKRFSDIIIESASL